MTNVQTTQQSIQKQPPKFSAFLSGEGVKGLINNAVGKNAQRFTTSILSAVSTNPTLQECQPQTILSAALIGESLNLSPSPQLGQYYLVPYNDKKKGKVAQFQLGYKGYIQLAIRSGYYRKLNVLAVKEGELVKFDPIKEELIINLIEDEAKREAAPTIGYYAMFEYVNGFQKAIYWSYEKMLLHADRYSQAFSKDGGMVNGKKKVSYIDYKAGKYNEADEWLYSSFWYKDFDAMALKTMIRQLIGKWGVMSIEMQNAYVSDGAIINEDGIASYVECEESEPIEPQKAPETEVSDEEKKEFDFFGNTV